MREVGGNLDALFEHLRKREALHAERLVSFEPKRPVEGAVSPGAYRKVQNQSLPLRAQVAALTISRRRRSKFAKLK